MIKFQANGISFIALCCLMLLSITFVQADLTVSDVPDEENVDPTTEDDTQSTEQSKNQTKEKEPEPYDVRIMKFGQSDKENFDEFGVITNHFIDEFTSEVYHNHHPSMIYVADGNEITKKGSLI